MGGRCDRQFPGFVLAWVGRCSSDLCGGLGCGLWVVLVAALWVCVVWLMLRFWISLVYVCDVLGLLRVWWFGWIYYDCGMVVCWMLFYDWLLIVLILLFFFRLSLYVIVLVVCSWVSRCAVCMVLGLVVACSDCLGVSGLCSGCVVGW